MTDFLRKYGLLGLVTALLIGEIIGFTILVPLAGEVADQAKAGNSAKMTQCARNPVSQKLALAAYAVRHNLPERSRITAAELEAFKKTSPKNCPKRK